eukprot:g41620.t1
MKAATSQTGQEQNKPSRSEQPEGLSEIVGSPSPSNVKEISQFKMDVVRVYANSTQVYKTMRGIDNIESQQLFPMVGESKTRELALHMCFHMWSDQPRKPLTARPRPQSSNRPDSTPGIQSAPLQLSAAPHCSRPPVHCTPTPSCSK